MWQSFSTVKICPRKRTTEHLVLEEFKEHQSDGVAVRSSLPQSVDQDEGRRLPGMEGRLGDASLATIRPLLATVKLGWAMVLPSVLNGYPIRWLVTDLVYKVCWLSKRKCRTGGERVLAYKL